MNFRNSRLSSLVVFSVMGAISTVSSIAQAAILPGDLLISEVLAQSRRVQ
jgi:hypothetical protein